MRRPLSWKPTPPRLRRRPAAPGAAAGARQLPPPPEGVDDVISADTRRFVWRRDGGRCRHCGSTTRLHFDHIIPRSWGGASTAENVELLCERCNLRKGARLSAPPA